VHDVHYIQKDRNGVPPFLSDSIRFAKRGACGLAAGPRVREAENRTGG